MLGGYLSRVPAEKLVDYGRVRLFRLLFDLSARRPVGAARIEAAIEESHREAEALQIGYAIVDTSRVSPQLLAFAKSALDLQLIATEGAQALYIVR
jgi:hypothetical protein